jgi:chromosomal replication initiator protein
MTALNELKWNDILEQVDTRHPNVTRAWFKDLRFADLHHGVVEISCANSPQQRYLSEHCVQPFMEAAQALTGCLVSVRFRVRGADARRQGNGELSFADDRDQVVLDPDYTFDEFVTGPSNRLAQAASMAVSENPGETYNPLFVHGNVGLGKTHLLQAICHRARSQRPDVEILYLTCETFTNHFIEAVERGALEHFRYRYRHVDILLIDDIQFLAEREHSQEEFFHTFNTLYQTRKQIVLSADCSPREIPSLENRLVSRFSWGLVTRIDPPCLETRMAILRKKAKRRAVELPEDVVHHLAQRIDSNTRELEGAITLVDALSQQLGKPIDLQTAREALGVQPGPGRAVTIPQILEVVTRHFNVKKSELLGKRRTKSIALPRQVCMHLARHLTDHSLEEIGNYFGGRDHTTAMHAIRAIETRLRDDHRLSEVVRDLKSQLSSNGTP